MRKRRARSRIAFIEEVGEALMPKVEVDVVKTATNLTFETREALMKHPFVRDGLLAHITEADEWFEYSESRNMWFTYKPQ